MHNYNIIFFTITTLPSHCSLSPYAITTFAVTNILMHDRVFFLSLFPYDSNANFMASKHWKDFSIGECVQNFWHAWNTPFLILFTILLSAVDSSSLLTSIIEQFQGLPHFPWWWPSSAQTLENHFWLWLHPSQLSGVSHQQKSNAMVSPMYMAFAIFLARSLIHYSFLLSFWGGGFYFVFSLPQGTHWFQH